jgi:hypothetical protein
LDNPVINKHGVYRWYDENENVHRDDGPASIWADGTKIWYRYGHEHRDAGPSTIWPDGSLDWCLDGNMYSFENWLEKTPISCEQKVMLKLKYG